MKKGLGGMKYFHYVYTYKRNAQYIYIYILHDIVLKSAITYYRYYIILYPYTTQYEIVLYIYYIVVLLKL